ncbi:hypothetical protein TEA_020982 [Camellia sinensis var. sinensis]|uniref:Sulfotransferase n=1 Tax=Camellia sinensis var. sinensis TaxID=542762 RepID=A0A4S4ECQ8_CAMSN|nr:hypothetical protein TEA_020982 [Camellia sinensis var. sinensis]
MDHASKFIVLLVLLVFASSAVSASHSKDDYQHCESTVNKWASSSIDLEVKEDKHILRDLLFFLHIPRTGGRTYFYCFLKKLYASSLECPRSYDKLRFDPSKPNCRLLVTHDDYSMMSKLPKEKTSVVTILRNPIDRVFSTYEFSIEVAARFLVHPNLTSATQMIGRLRSKNRGISTLDIWPWKYLVPWMREDLFARRDARRDKGPNYFRSNDSYNMEDMVMPLQEYINDPIARDIIHNGATFQIAGLTNNSYLPESHEVRRCVLKHQTLGEYVLEVAKKRLDDMLYIGLTEDHRESATMFANVVGAQVISQSIASSYNAEPAVNDRSEASSSSLDSKSDTSHYQNTSTDRKASKISSTENVEPTNENKLRTLPLPYQMTVEKLMDSYETCISSLRKTQAQRRNISLKRISPANFTKKARLQVPEVLLQEIQSLNSLDIKLYEYAGDIFSKQHEKMTQKFAGASWAALGVTIRGEAGENVRQFIWCPHFVEHSMVSNILSLTPFVHRIISPTIDNNTNLNTATDLDIRVQIRKDKPPDLSVRKEGRFNGGNGREHPNVRTPSGPIQNSDVLRTRERNVSPRRNRLVARRGEAADSIMVGERFTQREAHGACETREAAGGRPKDCAKYFGTI